jgi:hypothetical protein
MSPTAPIWPDGVELWPTIVALVLSIAIFCLSLCTVPLWILMTVFLMTYVLRPRFAHDLCHRGLWAPMLFISAVITTVLSTISAGLLKSRPDIDASLSVLSCTLAAETNRYDHVTVCQCNVPPIKAR